MAPKIVFGATAGFGAIDGAAIHDRRRLEVSRFQFEIAFVFGSTFNKISRDFNSTLRRVNHANAVLGNYRSLINSNTGRSG